jgi:hypothetical protein
MHPDLENARKAIWERPDKDGRIARRPTSIGQLLGKAMWEKPLAVSDWIVATGVGLLGPRTQDYEAKRVERNEGWRREPFAWEEIGYLYGRHRPGFVFTLIFISLSSLVLCFLFFLKFISLPVGPHPPNG